MKNVILMLGILVSFQSIAKEENKEIIINQPEDKVSKLIDKTCDAKMNRVTSDVTLAILGGSVKFKCQTLTFSFDRNTREYYSKEKGHFNRNKIHSYRVSIFDKKINKYILNNNDEKQYLTIRSKIEKQYGKSNEVEVANSKIKNDQYRQKNASPE